MKSIEILVSVFSVVSSQHLNASCALGYLEVDIPYPDERTAKLLQVAYICFVSIDNSDTIHGVISVIE